VQVGDLVSHNKNGFVGIIVKIAHAQDTRPAPLYCDALHYIWWFDGAKGACWSTEIEVISASR